MSFQEGSKWQEWQEWQEDKAKQDANKKQLTPARVEKQQEDSLIEKALLNVYEKANKLEFQDFKGWLKGEGYSLSKRSI